MEILYFILGVATVLIIFGVVVIFRMHKVLNDLKKFESETLATQGSIINELDRSVEKIHNEMDHRFGDTYKDFGTADRNLENIISELDRKIDSRFDKFINNQQKQKQKDLLTD